METSRKIERIRCTIVRDEDGYPPLDFEFLRAEKLRNYTFKIVSMPFFVNFVGYKDVINALKCDNDDVYCYSSIKLDAKFGNINIIILDKKCQVEIERLIIQENVYYEIKDIDANIRMMGVAIPCGHDYATFEKVLKDMESSGVLSYSELVLPT